MIGKTISHYHILEELGRGGMGVVYKAEDIKLNRTVALKFLPSEWTRDEEAKTRFLHEAQAASSLDHNHICTIHEISEMNDGHLYIVMACYEGESLKQKIGRGPLPIEEVLDFAIQTARGLAKAHSKKIIHRDIKPANILITEDKQIKIVDFGLAKLSGRTMLTKIGTTLGTVAYMSPEQVQGTEVDRRTDVWSMGVVLYEMVAGLRPFVGDYDQSIMYAIMNEEAGPLTGLRTGVPIELEHIINKALAKNPKERYQHIDEMIVDLQSIRKQLKHGKTKEPRGKTKFKRNKQFYLYSAIVIFLILATIISVNLFLLNRTDIDSIMVLPLKNYTGDPEQEYFVDGMTEALITELSRIKALRVISHTSSMRYKSSNKSPPEIAGELDVDAVVEGSVLRTEEQVRITAQLIDARADKHLWADNFDRDLGDILKLHSQVARAIVDQIRITLTPQDKARFDSVEVVDPEAYQLYLRGRYFWNQFTEKSLLRSVDFFEQAIARDRNYALAYAGLASAYSGLSNDFLPPHETMPKVRQAAIRALELDETIAAAHTALGLVKFFYERDWDVAEKEFVQAIKLNPNSAEAHTWLSSYLIAMERQHESILEIEKAKKLDPLSLILRSWWEWNMLMAGRYDDTIELCLATLDVEPEFAWSIAVLGLAHALKGDFEKTVEISDKINQIDDASVTPLIRTFLTQVSVLAGREKQAELQLADLLERAKVRHVCGYEVALVYAMLGDKDQAFVWLEQAFKDASDCLVFSKVDPRFQNLHSDPRYQEFLKKVGFEK